MDWHIAHIGPVASPHTADGFTQLPVGALMAVAYQADAVADRRTLGLTHYRHAASHGGHGIPMPFGLFGGELEQAAVGLKQNADVLAQMHERLAGSAEVTLSLTSPHPVQSKTYLRARKQVQQSTTRRNQELEALAQELAQERFELRDRMVRADRRCERTSHLDLTCATGAASRLLARLTASNFSSNEIVRLGGPFVPFGASARAWTAYKSEVLPC